MDIIQLISQVGFPIAVASYSLVKLDETIGKHTEVIVENTKTLVALRETVSRCEAVK